MRKHVGGVRSSAQNVNAKRCTHFAPRVVYAKVTIKVITIEVPKSPNFCCNNACERDSLWTLLINSIYLVDIYADEGISGTNMKNRREFNRMIEECKARYIDLVITKSISRFARNTLDVLQYTRELKAKQVAIYFEKENIHTMDAS